MLRTTLLKFPNSRQAFHTSRIVREEWTKASLRRMKKVELTRLAKENNLNFSGTKNDIIIQLLTHQTAKIVGSSTPSIRTIKNIAEPEAAAEEDFEPDNAWMNAFEMKVAQRGSRKAVDNTNDHFTSTSKPHHYNDQIKPSTLLQPTQDKPKPTSSASPVPIISSTTTTNENITAEDLEGMDPQWVEAFELKVGSRGARSHLTDTLSPSTSATTEPFENIEFISIESKKEDKEHEKKEHTVEETKDQKKAEEHKVKEDKVKEDKKEEHHVEKHTKHHNKQQNPESHSTQHNESQHNSTASSESDNSSRETIINTAVGSSMFLWYYGEGLSKIWHFLTSSP